jgi:hypothetical protein
MRPISQKDIPTHDLFYLGNQMSNPATDTIQNSYNVVMMPDGTEKLVCKQTDGTWDFVDNRLKLQKEMEDRFKGTETVPSNWNPATEIQGLIKEKKISTSDHLKAHLIEVLGSPTGIIKNGLDPKKKEQLSRNGAEKATLLVIIRSLNDTEWNLAAKLL